MAETPTTTPAPAFGDTFIDSLKAPFANAASVPNAKPLYTALIYAGLGVLIGRAL